MPEPGIVSDCCGASVVVAGRTTQHYECTACGSPCDAVTRREG